MGSDFVLAVPGVESASLIRRSCDRCHKQKLRCTRSENSKTNACDRCLPKRLTCVYSFSMPKGRPSLNRSMTSSDTAIKNANLSNNAEASLSSTTAPFIPLSVTSSHDVPPQSFPRMSCTALDPFAWGGGPRGEMASWGSVEGPKGSTTKVKHIHTDHPSFESVSSDESNKFPALTTPYVPNDAANNDMMDCDAGENPQIQQVLAHFQTNKVGLDSDQDDRSDYQDSTYVVAELAKLNVRLSQLSGRFSSVAYQHDHRSEDLDSEPLIDVAAFESVCEWLGCGGLNIKSPSLGEVFRIQSSPLPAISETKTAGALLHLVFMASKHFLEIVNYLQTSISVHSPQLSSNTSLSFPGIDEGISDEVHVNGSIPSAPSSKSSSASRSLQNQRSFSSYTNVIRQMLSSCDTNLLNVYLAVFAILEREATNAKLQSHRASTTALGDIR